MASAFPGSAHPAQRSRTVAALAAAAIQLGMGWVLIQGLAGRGESHEGAPDLDATLVTVTTAPEPEPPAPEPSPAASRDSGAANLEAEPLPRVAPKAKIALPQPLPAAPASAQGVEADTGAADRPGPGSGAAGAGSGLGAGGSGSGAGTGGGSRARHVAGALRDSDYPREAKAIRAAGTVAIRYVVRTDGLVDRCAVLASSGHAILDTLTCRLVERRYRYRPARDAAGRPVEQEIRTTFTWGVR